jgi:phosphatidate cytidylyltransferase
LLLTRVITAAVVITALLAALLLLDRARFAVVVAAIVVLAGLEWARLSGARSVLQVLSYAVGCGLLYFGLLQSAEVLDVALWLAAAFWVVAVPWWMSRGFLPGPAGLLPIAGLVAIVPAGAAMATLAPAMLLVLIGLTAIADTAAYFCGRAFGRRKLAPAISPGKTLEGAAGGAVGCLIYATICAMLIPEFQHRIQGASWIPYLGATVVLCAASVIGDLFESALKRRAGAKDSGRLLPGHGGVLDRIDSAVAALPLGLLMLRGTGFA